MDAALAPSRSLLPPGHGALTVARVADASAAVQVIASAPLKLLVPRSRASTVWAYVATFGGGLLPGDSIHLDIDVTPGASAMLATQASTKVFRRGDHPASQTLVARIAEGSLLAVLPDPVCCFDQAVYHQRQRFELAPGGSLVFLDWLTAGRVARHERWSFASFRSVTEISLAGRLAVRDALLLEELEASPVADRLGRFDVLATVALTGPAVARVSAEVLAHIGAMPVERRPSVVASASPMEGGTLVRVAAEHIEDASRFVRSLLADVPALLGGDPWNRK